MMSVVHPTSVVSAADKSTPGLARVSTERVARAKRLKRVCAERVVTCGMLARFWDVSPQRAHHVLNRKSGPDSERIRLLPATVQREVMGE
jgi:hypothetical protein